MKKLIFILSCILLVSCVPKKKLVESQNETSQMEKKVKELEAKNKVLTEQYQTLYNQNQQCISSVRNLVQNNEQYTERIIDLNKRLENLRNNKPEIETTPVNTQEEVNVNNAPKSTTSDIHQVVDVKPEFKGGSDKMYKFLSSNIKYPQKAKLENIKGRVYIRFIVEKDGTLTDPKVLRGIGSGCDEEALRVVKLMPKWFPGKLRGKPVRTSYILPITFVLR
mgnify:CR=1 FL=1